MSDLRFVIITRNSARWFGPVLDAYRASGIEPFVLLDNSSSDDSERLLREKNVDYAMVEAAHPRVEAFISLIPEHVTSKWVIRLDDDELPGRGLCEWVRSRLRDLPFRVVGFQRRTLRRMADGSCEYSRHPLIVSRAGVVDAQWRMFRPSDVSYVARIHTPGFEVPKGSPIAPNRAFIGHFNWLVRSLEERRRQLESYNHQEPGAGSRFHDIMLWEESDAARHRFQAMETEEFNAVAAVLAGTLGKLSGGLLDDGAVAD